MPYSIEPHTADVAVAASGPTLASVLASLADGMSACMYDGDTNPSDTAFTTTVTAESPEALVFDTLDRLIYERDMRDVLPVEHSVELEQTGDQMRATITAQTIPLEDIAAREIKAVTYSEMTVERRDGTWYGYVVFDV